MKHTNDRLMQAIRTIARVSASAIPIEKAIGTALSSVGGKVFDAKLKEIDQKVVWRVKLLVEGQRVKVYVDACSGKVISAKAEIVVDERFGKKNHLTRHDCAPSIKS